MQIKDINNNKYIMDISVKILIIMHILMKLAHPHDSNIGGGIYY